MRDSRSLCKRVHSRFTLKDLTKIHELRLVLRNRDISLPILNFQLLKTNVSLRLFQVCLRTSKQIRNALKLNSPNAYD